MKRSANLTKHLLAFSRRQPLEPNKLVHWMSDCGEERSPLEGAAMSQLDPDAKCLKQ